MDKMFQLLIVSLFFIVSTTNGLSLPPGNVDSVDTTNSSLGEIAETLDAFEKMSNDTNFNVSDSVEEVIVSDKIDKEKAEKIEDKIASELLINNKEDANSTSTTPKTVSTSTPASTTTKTTTASTPASSSTTTSATVTTSKPLNSSSSSISTGLTYNDTVLETAFDSNGTMVNEIMSSMDSILHELSSNSSESSSNDLDSPSLTSGEFNNYFEELRVLDGLEALFESD